MGIFKPLILKGSVEIKTTPEKIWDFLSHLEENYKSWHPKEHVLVNWTEGKPMETGSKYYAEEYIRGKLRKFYGTIGEVILYKKVVFKHGFPISLASMGFKINLEPKNSYIAFTVVNYINAHPLISFFARFSEYGTLDDMIKVGKKHTLEEGQNLKRILEG